MLEWCVVEMFKEEIRAHPQIMPSVLGTIFNIIGGPSKMYEDPHFDHVRHMITVWLQT
jgi:hypothetical protein